MSTIQRNYPEIVDIIKSPIKTSSSWNIVYPIIGGGSFITEIDTSAFISSGSFGRLYTCKVKQIKNGILEREELNYLFKLIDNSNCDRSKTLKVNTELSVQTLLWKTTDKIPKTYPYVYTLHDTTNTGLPICYNGFIIERIMGNLSSFRNRLCNKSNGFPEQIVDKYFGVVNKIKDILTSLYDTYKFKHNDLHSMNVLFDDYDPKIIDFGESTIRHRFDNSNINIIPTREQIDTLYDISDNKLLSELSILYKSFPLSDLHLYVFSSYYNLSKISNLEITSGGKINIVPNYTSRLDEIYRLSFLTAKNNVIYYNGVSVADNKYKGVYNVVYNIILNSMNKRSSLKEYYDYLFDKWNMLHYRYLAYFMEVFLGDRINYSSFTKVKKAVMNVSVPKARISPPKPESSKELSKVPTRVSVRRPALSKKSSTKSSFDKEFNDRFNKLYPNLEDEITSIDLNDKSKSPVKKEEMSSFRKKTDKNINEYDELMNKWWGKQEGKKVDGYSDILKYAGENGISWDTSPKKSPPVYMSDVPMKYSPKKSPPVYMSDVPMKYSPKYSPMKISPEVPTEVSK